jgi:ABC-type transport system involved in cytochrome c biogenesis permease component
MMLVTGLTGPIFLALSLFPTSNKPVVTWITSFLSMGLCKICFSLISGLSAVAMVYAGYDNVDMLVAAVVLGLLAPVLSFSIATGSGLGALTTITYSAQSFGINAGVSSYNPSVGQVHDNNIPVAEHE